MPISGIRRRIRQGYTGKRIEITQAGTRKAQTQVQPAQVTRISQGTGKRYTGIGDLNVGLQGEWLAGIL
ncbi:hypothetical protein D3C77_481970 [compost metagenome]